MVFPNNANAIEQKFGSKRGLACHVGCLALYALGMYRGYRNIPWNDIRRLVFVCKGNICRSPYAAAIARSQGLQAISCGISTGEGAPADSRAQRLAMARGIDLSAHQTVPIDKINLQSTDLAVGMEPWHVRYISRQPRADYCCTILGLWGRPVTPYIHDPFNASTAYYKLCFDIIDNSVAPLVAKLRGK